MRVLLDNNVNQRFAALVDGHEVVHARQLGWGELLNGKLISAAEEAGFDVMITADKQMQYQQNLTGRRIAIIVLNSVLLRWTDIEPLAPHVNELLRQGVEAGSFHIAILEG
jgi:hypothetical protein